MNKKQNLVALALSVSFVLGGAGLSHADESKDSTSPIVSEQEYANSDNHTGNIDQVGNLDDQKSTGPAANNQEKSSGENTEAKLGENAAGKEKSDQDKADAKPSTNTADPKNPGVNQPEKENTGDRSSQNQTESINTGLVDDQGPNTDANTIEVSGEKQNQAQKASPSQNKGPVTDVDPVAEKPLTDEEVEKLTQTAQKSYPDGQISVDKNTGIITVKRKVKEKKGDKEVEVEKVETINPYTPAGDEKLIKDYSESERYKTTDLEPGDTNQALGKTNEKVEKDGFKFELKNPSATSPSKTEYGYQITIDKKTGQRTYTKIYVTDSGLIPLDKGNKPMMGQGEKLTPESPDVTYKPDENAIIDGAGKQRNLNYDASEETLKHLNNKDNDSTSFGFKDDYTQDNPKNQFFKGSFGITYKVNPWPNENDKLEELKLNKNNYDPTSKYFVQGQDIDTGIKVDNIDDSAKERLVGQVYNPITGKIVPGASAYIGDNGNIFVKMPEGALKKDENGKTIINEDSIFNTDDYKALQNLDVKFFARPRKTEEFRKIAETPDEYGETGTYVETGAGSATIKHKGQDVVIDKQGIDRYDHYNLIGGFKLNLDDTRYYDQSFKDKKGDTSERTYSNVKPGEAFNVEMYNPESPKPNQKTAEEMNAADGRGEASGRINMDFLNKENEGKAEKDKWKLDVDPHDISKFTITAPSSAKAGDFIALPVEYTYTNGSKDVHWFHFVVQDSDNNKPEYHAQVEFPSDEQNSQVSVPENDKKLSPKSYSIPEGTEFKDDHGNEWDVSINETTGQITAKPKNPSKFDGGEKLEVPVVAHYQDPDEPDKDITEETTAEFVIKERANMTARYNAKAGKAGDEISSDVILNKTDEFNRRPTRYSLKSNTYADDKGNTWNVSIDEKTGKVTATVPNATDGKSIDGALLNVPVTAHYYEGDTEVGTRETEVQFIASGTKGTHTYTEELPFEVEVRKDPSLKKGEWKYATDDEGNELRGEKGEQERTLTIENSKVTKTSEPTVTKKAKNAVVLVGEGTNDGTHEIKEKKELPFETRYEYDENLEAGQREETGGTPGEQERTNTLVIKDGKVTETKEGEFKTTKDPVDKVIKIGIKPIIKEVEKPFETEYIYDENVEVGNEEEVTSGEKGKVTITTSYDKDQNKLVTKEETKDPVKRVVKVGIKPVVKEEEIPHDTEYKHNPNLEAGTIKKIKDGTPGKITVTTTFNKETGKLETKVERTEPTNAEYEYGSKTEGKVKVESDLPFEIEIIEDPEMEAGKTETVQEGKLGKKETTITIENSKEVSREEKVITDPVKKIVKVGTKNVCPIPPVNPKDPENPAEPGKEDPEKPVNEDPKPAKPGKEDPEKPGHEDPKPEKTEKEDPEKPVNEDPKSEKEDPRDEENTKKENKDERSDELSRKHQDSGDSDDLSKKKSSNPKTGIGSVTPVITAMGISIAGLLGTKKKKKED
uniref:adhesin domain containing protein n=1 Tax=Anaerococcus mediterraneensis TaxID=1870984 RepID=UPI0009F8137C|nr:adhesin domain containing protein [Anaerococcus mediterraneensis]